MTFGLIVLSKKKFEVNKRARKPIESAKISFKRMNSTIYVQQDSIAECLLSTIQVLISKPFFYFKTNYYTRNLF